MIPETVLRELGAQTRTFQTVKGALMFLRNHLDRKLSVARNYESGQAPRSAEKRHEDNATAAKISQCLKGIEHVAWLVSWYETTWGDGQFLADKAGITRWAFTRRCRKTEREVRERMELVGLLGET